MPQTKIGVIYDKNTGQVLRVIIPAADSQLALHVGKDEALLEYDRKKYVDLTHENFYSELSKMVETASGKIFVQNTVNTTPIKQKPFIQTDPNPELHR